MSSLLHRTIWCNRGWMPFFYGFCPSEKAWCRSMKRMGLKAPYPTAAGHCLTLTNNEGKRCSVVTIREDIDREPPLVIIGLIAHEAMHVWQELKLKIGESDASQELEAYSYQAIFQELLEAYVNTRNPKMLRQSRPAKK